MRGRKLASNLHITLTEENKVLYTNGKEMGEFVMDVDGYWKFFPDQGGGYWVGWVLREIADIEDELNSEWDKQIREYFDKTDTKTGKKTCD